jgi:TFIIF-interacting CTD phosphatase-like protein
MSIFNNKLSKSNNTRIQSLFINSLQNSIYTKPHIFLDLDNTIINALTPDELEACYKIDFKPETHFAYHDFKIDGEMLYRIFERPYLQRFLDYLFVTFNVSVFTAADNDYASFIVDNVINIKGRKINYFFYGYHAEITARSMRGLKDLDLLWNIYKITNIDPCNTLILDDNKEVYNTNKENCIRVPAFSVINEDIGKPNTKSKEDNYLIDECIDILNNKLIRFQNKGCITESKDIDNTEYFVQKFIYEIDHE